MFPQAVIHVNSSTSHFESSVSKLLYSARLASDTFRSKCIDKRLEMAIRNILCKKILGSMLNMIIGETGHRKIAVVIIVLEPDIET